MTINSGNIFSALSLSRYMLSSLSENTPQLRNPLDATALLIHACMLSVGFRLIGLGEDHQIDATSEPDNIKPLPQEWNATSSNNYAFRYAHSQSALQYLVKVSRLGNKAVINGIGLGDDKVHSLDFLIRDFISESSFPLTLASGDDDKHLGSLQDCFISTGRITDLGSLFKLQIIQKLAPGLHKEGYEDSHTKPSPQLQQPNPGEEPHQRSELRDPLRDDRLPLFAPPRPSSDNPLTGPPRRPFPAGDFPPPGFDDEYDINRPTGRGGLGGERRPLNIGERDLYPPGLGPHDPFGSGLHNPGRMGGGGGMHPTFDDPLFGGGDGGGMGAYDPRAPPGARYDPIGPVYDGHDPLNDFPGRAGRGGPRFPGPGPGPGRGGFGGFGSGDFI